MITTARQLKDLIRNLSKKKSADAQILMRNYMMERFLERISLIDDGVSFRIKQISEIMEEADYPGVRVSMETKFDGVITPLKIDISTGDVITPREIRYSFNLMLEDRAIEVWAYNLETVLAEKLETIISRNVTNTRMRDFYDIYILQKLYGEQLSKDVLWDALVATAKKRGTLEQIEAEDIGEVFDEIQSSPVMENLWKAYQRNYSYADDLSWHTVMNAVRVLYQTVYAERNGTYCILHK